jgi:subtilisin family serine protease
VYSTYRNGGYAELSGTSMATPHVSATVALIQALRVASGKSILDPEIVYNVLTSTAIDIGPPGFDVYSGYGLVDAIAAVNKALSLP